MPALRESSHSAGREIYISMRNTSGERKANTRMKYRDAAEQVGRDNKDNYAVIGISGLLGRELKQPNARDAADGKNKFQ